MLNCKLFYFIFILLVLGCNNGGHKEKGSGKIESQKITSVNMFQKKLNKGIVVTDTTGFLSNCKLLMKRSHYGALQGINANKDSTGYLYFASNYYSTETYEIIFVYKGGIKKRKFISYHEMEGLFQNSCGNTFSDFDCFAFVIPMRDPEKQDDIHGTKYDFPVNVRVYKRLVADKWAFVRKLKVNSYQEYRNIQFNTIYGLN